MKRSEVILKICNELENSICASGLMGDVAFDDVAEMVLVELTKIGMLPKPQKRLYEVKLEKDWDTGKVYSVESYIDIYEWEPEDD